MLHKCHLNHWCVCVACVCVCACAVFVCVCVCVHVCVCVCVCVCNPTINTLLFAQHLAYAKCHPHHGRVCVACVRVSVLSCARACKPTINTNKQTCAQHLTHATCHPQREYHGHTPQEHHTTGPLHRSTCTCTHVRSLCVSVCEWGGGSWP
jgi:hypothetical protein